MVLIINTIERSKIEIGIFKNQVLRCFEFETEKPHFAKASRGKQSEDLLVAIEGVLENNSLTLKDIKAFLINQGPGSFTGVRVGVTVANTLAWSLDIPVFGYREGEFEKTLAKISEIKQNKFSKIVLPYYAQK